MTMQEQADYRAGFDAGARVASQAASVEIEQLRAALRTARAALTADTIGTIHMDDPDWYQQVDKAVAEIDAALAHEQNVSGEVT